MTSTAEPAGPLWRYRGKTSRGSPSPTRRIPGQHSFLKCDFETQNIRNLIDHGVLCRAYVGEGAEASFWTTPEGQSTFVMTPANAPTAEEWPALRMGPEYAPNIPRKRFQRSSSIFLPSPQTLHVHNNNLD